MVPDLTKQCKGIGAHVRHHYWNKISRAGQLAERDHPVWQLPTSGAMHSGRLSSIFWDAPFSYLHASTDIGEVVDWIKGKFMVATKVTWLSSITVTRWLMPSPPLNGSRALVEPSFREVSRPVQA